MKILLINKFLFPKGGDALYTLNLGKFLSSKGHKVSYWGMEHPGNHEYRLRRLFVASADMNSPVQASRQSLKIAMNMLYSVEARKKVSRVVEREKPDIVHVNNIAHQISPSILHVFERHKIPVVMTVHDYKLICPSYNLLNNNLVCERCAKGRYYKCVSHKCVKKSRAKSLLAALEMYMHHKVMDIYGIIDIFISPSKFLKVKMEEMGFRRHVEVLPNFLDYNSYAPEYKSKRHSIIYFGRLSEEKGLYTLLGAIRGLKDIALDIIGDGPIRSALEVYAAKKEIRNVSFLGFKSGEELQEAIRQSMFSVIASIYYDNSPLSIIESFALGKPVVGSRIGGIPEIVDDYKTGMTFEPGNHRDLREKIRYLADFVPEREEMGRNARNFVENERNAEDYYNSLMKIYEKCINKHSSNS